MSGSGAARPPPADRGLIADHQTDWVNSLFLSMRFRARRIGPYNEYLYTFFKCLAADRLMYAEGWYAEQNHDEEDIQLGDWIIQRRRPHLRADLTRFGRTDGTTLTCAMHGWQFDLPTGRCLGANAGTHHLRSRPAQAETRYARPEQVTTRDLPRAHAPAPLPPGLTHTQNDPSCPP